MIFDYLLVIIICLSNAFHDFHLTVFPMLYSINDLVVRLLLDYSTNLSVTRYSVDMSAVTEYPSLTFSGRLCTLCRSREEAESTNGTRTVTKAEVRSESKAAEAPRTWISRKTKKRPMTKVLNFKNLRT